MGVSIIVQSVTRNDKTGLEGVTISKSLRSIPTCSIRTVDRSGSYLPAVGNHVEIQDDGTIMYGGSISEVERLRRYTAITLLETNVSSVGLADRLEKRLAGEYQWSGLTGGAIIRDIVANSLTGDITDVTLVEDGPIVETFVSTYPTVREAIEAICNLTGYEYYVRPDGKLAYFPTGTHPAPFSITTGANVTKLTTRETREDFANIATAHVGNLLRDAETQAFVGDGATKSWNVTYPITATPVIFVGGVEKTVGVTTVDTGKDWYWSDGSSEVRQDDLAAAVGIGIDIDVTYVGTEQVYISISNDASIAIRAAAEANSGWYHKLIKIDERLTRADALAVVQAYVDRHSELSLVLTIETNNLIEPDLKEIEPGQVLTVSLTGWHASGDYLVRTVALQMRKGDNDAYRWEGRIEAVSGPVLRNYVDVFRQTQTGSGGISRSGSLVGSGGVPPDAVTIVSAEYEYIDAYTVRVKIYWTPPVLPGVFIGVHCYEEDPDVSSIPTAPMDGTQAMDGTANMGGEWAPIDRGKGVASPFVIEMEAPRETVNHRFYLTSYSESAEAELVRATEASPTPSITLAIAAPIYQSGVEYAQLVVNAIATVDIDDTQVSGPVYQIGFLWQVPTIAPAAWQRGFGGVQIVYEYFDGRQTQGPSLAVNETYAMSQWYPIYVGTTSIICWFVSYDNSDEPRLNTIVQGVTPQSTVTFTWPLSARPASAPYCDNVTNFEVSNARYAVNGQGQKVLSIDWSWTLPSTATALARFGGAIIYLFIPSQPTPYQITGLESASAGIMEFAHFPQTAETWVFWAIAQDNNNNQNTNPAAPISGTPTDSILVSPPLNTVAPVTGFSVTVAYGLSGEGQKALLVTPIFTPPADVEWAWITFAVEIQGVIDKHILGFPSESGANSVAEITAFPATTEQWAFRAYSVDVNGKESATYVRYPTSGFISVGPPADGPAGQEKTSHVTGASFSVATVSASDGTTMQRLTATFTRPADVTWGGVEGRVYDGATLVSKKSVAASPWTLDIPNPTTSTTLTIKLVSFNVNGQTNTEVALTPQGTVLVGSTAGTLDIRKFLPASTDNFTIVGTYLQIKTGVAIEVDGSGNLRVQALGITDSLIASGAVDNSKVVNGAIDDLKLASAAVTAAKIAANAVTSPAIQAGAVTAGKIAALSIVAGDIATDAITSAKIIAGAITTVKINAGAVTANEIAALAVVAGKVAANAITATEIATDAVTAGKILAGSITTVKIDANAVSSDKLDATVINVGGGGSKPGKFYIYDSGGSLMGFIGVDSGLAAFQINYNGTTTTIANGFDSNLSEYVGLKVRLNTGGYVSQTSLGLYVLNTDDTQGLASIIRSGSSSTASGRVRVGYASGSNSAILACASNLPRLTLTGSTHIGTYDPDKVSLGSNQIIGLRKTGWTLPTGFATRSGFATSTVTLPQLAEAVKALIDDLHATAGHGLIGA